MNIVTIKEFNRENADLEAFDEHCLLGGRRCFLASVLAATRDKEGILGDAVLMEFGAYHFRVDSDPLQGVYDPGISSFFAMYPKKLGIEYYAFDPDTRKDFLRKT